MQRIEAIARRFREKGATSPEKALTAQELGLPPQFEEAMKRRLGQTGVFVQVGGKYYLDEGRLSELEQGRGFSGGYGRGRAFRGRVFTLRIIRMVLGTFIVLLVLINFLTERSTSLWVVIAALVVVWIAVSVMQIYYLARARQAAPFAQ
jgi:hypothetical protein